MRKCRPKKAGADLKGRYLKMKKLMTIALVVMMLLGLMLVLTYKDILRIFQ